ncbi:MAG: C4-type zinc ribbon domain-containing protein [Clostridia bacterium]|nr:C4-type zinc ribbon domain-containing protein [Clostridia bacterium]
MSIEKMLKYQEVDMRLIKLENELKNSESAKKMIFYQTATKKSFDTLTVMNDTAKAAMDSFAKYSAKYDEICKQIDEIVGENMNDDDEKQLDYYSKQLEKLYQSLEDSEREAARASKELSDMGYKYTKEYEQAGKSSASYRKFAEEFNNLKKEKSVEAGAIMKELKVLEAGLDRELLDKYKKIRANKRPVLVPFRKPASCGGCGMEIASDIINKLGEGRRIQECPNCGRIIYNED